MRERLSDRELTERWGGKGEGEREVKSTDNTAQKAWMAAVTKPHTRTHTDTHIPAHHTSLAGLCL